MTKNTSEESASLQAHHRYVKCWKSEQKLRINLRFIMARHNEIFSNVCGRPAEKNHVSEIRFQTSDFC